MSRTEKKKSKRGLKETNTSSKGNLLLPTTLFKDRSVSVLEAISEYLKDEKGLTYHEIAVLLNRDDRTIWTCYNRAKKKRGGKK